MAPGRVGRGWRASIPRRRGADYIERTNSARLRHEPSDREAILGVSCSEAAGRRKQRRPRDDLRELPVLSIATRRSSTCARCARLAVFLTGAGVTALTTLVLLAIAWRSRPRAPGKRL